MNDINQLSNEELIRRLNDQYKNIQVFNHGEYWKCNLCNDQSEDFGEVRKHHMNHEISKIIKEIKMNDLIHTF